MQPHNLVGQVLGHYRIKRPVGYGGMATVFLAEDINLRRDVAVKVFEPGPGDSADFFRRFEREAQVLAQLDHPNILPVYDFGQQMGVAYLITPYIAGGSLREVLQARGKLPVSETIRLMSQILSALQYAHERGLIHRDIKPGNMLLKHDGTIMLSDFGLVKIASANSLTGLESLATLTGHMIAGTPDYMAPEQIAAQTMPASDIYAVGVVIYEMLTGAHLFTANDSNMGVLMKQLYEQPRPLRDINPSISPQLETAIMRALEKDPANRYQSPAGFLQALTLASSSVTPFIGIDIAGPTIGNAWQQQIQPPRVQSLPPTSAPTTPRRTGGYSEPTSMETVANTIQANQANPATPAPPVPPAIASTPRTPSGARPMHNANTFPDRQSPYISYPAQPPQPAPAQPQRSRRPIIFAAIIVVFLVLIAGISIPLFASSLFGTHSTQHGVTSTVTTNIGGKGGKGSTVTTVVTRTTGQLLTSCPAAGTARAAILPTFTPGNDANVVYIVNENTNGTPTFGTVKRHDVITRTSTEIIKTPNTIVSEAQVSNDGQWVLYNAIISGQDELRLIRIDGQDVQTLLCAPSGQLISGSQWSLNKQYVIFDQGGQTSVPVAYLLDLTNGSLQKELVPSGSQGYLPRTWLDRSHVVFTGIGSNSGTTQQAQQGLYLLDISKGANQPASGLQQIATTISTSPCWNFDTGFDTSTIYTSQCTGTPTQQSGPSTVSVQSINGGTANSIYTDPNAAITVIRDITRTKLLLLIENSSSSDTSRNGLWSINTNGTGLTRLTTDSDGSQALCPFSQYYWSNVSQDGNRYALQGYNSSTNEYKLLFGSFNGGNPTMFADLSDGTKMYLVGWAIA